MSSNHPKAGPNSVPAYQLSGIPYVTGSTGAEETVTRKEFAFPYVTRFITFSNTNNAATELMSIAFTSEGLDTGATQKNWFYVPANSSVTLDVRCKSVFVTTSADMQWSLCAGLTTIAASDFPTLTGSNGFAGVGGQPA